jgi:TPR repeat protein
VTCGCHDGPSCYDEAAQLASRRGEQAATAEELMYLTQCACFQGSSAGCNALGHFAKDAVKACEQGSKIDDSCTIAGLVYLHGVQVSPRHGRSYDRDPAIARRAFERACRAGAATACERLKN